MTQLTLKQQAAEKALSFIKEGEMLGIGTGSTVDCLIDFLPKVRHSIAKIASSSERSTQKLEALGFSVSNLTDLEHLTLYIDGADEINHQLQMIKGGGAALTREKIVAAHASQFICIADESKLVTTLGKFPLPIEVIPMAENYVAQELEKLGGTAKTRKDTITDNSNIIIDLYDFMITDPVSTETAINNITGVVTNGIFAKRPADKLILATTEGIKIFER